MTFIQYFSVRVYGSDCTDILFEVNSDTEEVPENIIALKNDFELFIKVLKVLFETDDNSFKYYFERVYALADLAFNSTSDQFILVDKSLKVIKSELVYDTGPNIRSNLLFKYIKLSVVPVLIMLSILFSIIVFVDGNDLNYFGNLVLVAIGAIVGCWLSLAVRTKSIRFEDILPVLNDERGVSARIIFVCLFSVSLAILMKSGLLSIQLGDFSSKTIETSYFSAFAAGLIMGFSEKMFVEKFESKISKVEL